MELIARRGALGGTGSTGSVSSDGLVELLGREEGFEGRNAGADYADVDFDCRPEVDLQVFRCEQKKKKETFLDRIGWWAKSLPGWRHGRDLWIGCMCRWNAGG